MNAKQVVHTFDWGNLLTMVIIHVPKWLMQACAPQAEIWVVTLMIHPWWRYDLVGGVKILLGDWMIDVNL